MTILKRYTNEELQILLDSSTSFREFLRKIKSYSGSGSGAYQSSKNYLIKRGLNIPDYNPVYYFRKRIPENELFIENSKVDRATIKKRLIKGNLIEYKCKKCNLIDTWQDEKIVLELEHINGINNDNRLENLCFLCPNCHSQTVTNSGRRNKKNYICNCGNEIYKGSSKCRVCYRKYIKRKVDRPILEILLEDVEKYGYVGTGRKYGVSDNAIRKWIKSQN